MNKKKIMITFRKGGENGGPFISHKRILESSLKNKYNFKQLFIPKERFGLKTLKIISDLKREIETEKPDLVHFTGLQLEGFYMIVACKLAKVKTVLAIHGSSSEAIEFSKFKKMILNILENITLKNANVSYGVSKYVSGWKKVRENCNEKYFGHIYNLPNQEYKNQKVQNSLKKEFGISKDELVIVSTGRITKEKGYDVLCNVVKEINTSKKIKFIIVGNGDYKNEMEKELQEEIRSKKVLFLGYRSDVQKILSISNIFIIATKHETLCNSIIEAGKQGLAIVATNVGGIPEIIDNNLNGYLVEKNSSIELIKYLKKIIENQEIRESFSRLIKQKIDKEFSEKKIIEELDQVYRRVLGE